MVEAGDESPVVIRFSPWTQTGLDKSIQKQVIRDELEGRVPRRGVSVFAKTRDVGATVDDTISELVEMARGFASGERLAVATADSLGQRGFVLHLNEPPRGHYLVGKEDLSEMPDTAELASVFDLDRRRNRAS